MKYLVVYAYKRGQEAGIGGSIGCVFAHDPPTSTDVVDMQHIISRQEGNDFTAIINWLQLSDDDDDDSTPVRNCYNCFYGGGEEEVGDRGHCWRHNGEPHFEQPDKDFGCDEWKRKED